MPERLEYSKTKNHKTQENKRTRFRKLVKDKFKIVNARLKYLYYYKSKKIWLNIIYEEEKEPLLNFIHFSNNHLKKEAMDMKIIAMGFY